MDIIINGKVREINKSKLSYSEVCDIANKPNDSSVTFSYKHRDDKKGGILSFGGFVQTRENMIINVHRTNNA